MREEEIKLNQDDGGPAFPCGTGVQPFATGISTRDYFAAASLVGILQLHGFRTGGSATVAQMAYGIADAMIKVRNRKGTA